MARAPNASRRSTRHHTFGSNAARLPRRAAIALRLAGEQRAQQENIQRIAEAGDLLLAGPVLDDGTLRGIYMFDVTTLEEARALTATDPAIQQGRGGRVRRSAEDLSGSGRAASHRVPPRERRRADVPIVTYPEHDECPPVQTTACDVARQPCPRYRGTRVAGCGQAACPESARDVLLARRVCSRQLQLRRRPLAVSTTIERSLLSPPLRSARQADRGRRGCVLVSARAARA